MIRAMLTYDPAQRPSAEALLQHPYITMYGGGSIAAKAGGNSNVISLRAFTPGLAGGLAQWGRWGGRVNAALRQRVACMTKNSMRGWLGCPAAEAQQPVEGPAGCGAERQGAAAAGSGGGGALGGSASGAGGAAAAAAVQPGGSRQLTYRDALAAGVAALPPAADPSTPRTPGGSAVGFTVQKGRPATSMATPMVSP